MSDYVSLIKDISDRQQIMQLYQKTGFIDREKAVEKIVELRGKDKDVAEVTVVKLTMSSVPFSQVSDQSIISELKMQCEILESKLLEKNYEV